MTLAQVSIPVDSVVDVPLVLAALGALPLFVTLVDDAGQVAYRSPAGGPADEPAVAAALTELVDDARLARCEQSREVELDASPLRAVRIAASPVGLAGQPLGVVAVVEDVSERRQLETVRRDFVANVSHELRTPIGAIGVLADTLAGQTEPSVVSRLLERITVEVERAGRIIDDLLDLSRIEAERTRGAVPVDVGGVVAAAVDRIEPVASRRGVTIRVDAPRGLLVSGDEVQLASAIANLIDNAVKYSDSGDAVDVTIGTDGQHAVVDVRDHGIGIPARDQDRIFERFYRVDPARSRQTGGTGLGLAIVRHVALNHRGEVTVRSEEGAGSTFTLRLPLAVA